MELLKVVWEKKEATAREILEGSKIYRDRSYQAVKTVLDIMTKKGILKRRKIGPVYLYSPQETQKKFLSDVLDNLVKNILDGSIMPLMIHILKNGKHTKEDVAELKKLVDSLEAKK
jgi:BlaI family penicillinase repressor